MAIIDHRRVIINGDDFGLSVENNAGIVAAHQRGVLSSTSLMIGGDAVEEAVGLARENPQLAIGLHITFSDTRPVLPAEQVPLLVQSDGYFPPNECAHRHALLSVTGRRQVRAEIAAQFRAFHATGLILDHFNVHRHAHQNNPLLAWLIFREAAKWNATATRVPFDPGKGALRLMRALILRRMGKIYGLAAPERSIGRDWTAELLAAYLQTAPAGTTELYFHPVTAHNHRYANDLTVLLEGRVTEAMRGLTTGGYRA